jgi:hypothetical protein
VLEKDVLISRLAFAVFAFVPNVLSAVEIVDGVASGFFVK